MAMTGCVTPAVRVEGWNVKFTIGAEARVFAGIYQVVDSKFITFRNVCEELRLCFSFSDDKPVANSSDKIDDPWTNVAFVLTYRNGLTSETYNLSFVQRRSFEKPVLSLKHINRLLPDIIEYHVVFHTDCDLPTNTRLNEHLKRGCAKYFNQPILRLDFRYLPPNKGSPDPVGTLMPLRGQAKAEDTKRLSSPLKISFADGDDCAPIRGSPHADNNGSLTRLGSPYQESDPISPVASVNQDYINGNAEAPMVVPPSVLTTAEARKYFDAFKPNLLHTYRVNADPEDEALCCAVSDEGQSWCTLLDVCPTINACHIVPQVQYFIYPLADNNQPELVRLAEAWERTWSPSNGILLRKDLHELFDARCFSIHPETFRVRVFVPSNTLVKFHNKEAKVHAETDLRALRHHYEMCCVENMKCARPRAPLPDGLLASRARRLALDGRNASPSPPGDREFTDPQTKRQRRTSSDQAWQLKDNSRTYNSAKEAEADLSGSESGHKRRRLEHY
ncbi:hypothetical protein F4860DRAFT_529903 [Xylaria cubensis]|nr:hypothetical protein F4860DRAFT_529903 [Xylaria cubensis]